MQNFVKILLLFILATFKWLYIYLNKRESKYYFETIIDRYIVRSPNWVFPYIFYFPYIIFTLIAVWQTPFALGLLVSMIIAYALAELFWFLVPNGARRPIIAPTSLATRILHFIYNHDNDTNAFPSAHVFVSLLCGYFSYKVFPEFIWIITGITCAICLSTLFTKQHYFVDVLGGGVVFGIAIFITGSLGFQIF